MVVVFLLLTLFMLQVLAVPGSISGVVTTARTVINQPLHDARLELTDSQGTSLVARTDVAGRFVFSGLGPGRYRLSVTRDGFLRQQLPKSIVVASGHNLADIVFRLEPAPTIDGWVQDEYGEPIANVLVEALRRSYDVRGKPTLTQTASAVTDDLGNYRIFWLDPGEYFLSASSPPDQIGRASFGAVVPTYFPGVNDPAAAQAVRVDIGREVRVDFQLQIPALWTVGGAVRKAETGEPMAATIILTPPAEDPNMSRYRAQSAATGLNAGRFSIRGVASGSYIVSAKVGSASQELAVFERISIRPVIAGDEYWISLSLRPPLAVRGRLFSEPGVATDFRQTTISLTAIDPSLPSPPSALVQRDGQFVLKGVLPGSYVLEVSGLPQDFYIKTARFGAVDVSEGSLDLQNESATPLQIFLGSDAGRLSVTVFDSENERHEGAHVVLLPDAARRQRRDQYRIAVSTENGEANIQGIPPGSYTVLAWETLEPNAYLNTDYMRAFDGLGAEVHIGPGDNPRISVRLIGKEP